MNNMNNKVSFAARQSHARVMGSCNLQSLEGYQQNHRCFVHQFSSIYLLLSYIDGRIMSLFYIYFSIIRYSKSMRIDNLFFLINKPRVVFMSKLLSFFSNQLQSKYCKILTLLFRKVSK